MEGRGSKRQQDGDAARLATQHTCHQPKIAHWPHSPGSAPVSHSPPHQRWGDSWIGNEDRDGAERTCAAPTCSLLPKSMKRTSYLGAVCGQAAWVGRSGGHGVDEVGVGGSGPGARLGQASRACLQASTQPGSPHPSAACAACSYRVGGVRLLHRGAVPLLVAGALRQALVARLERRLLGVWCVWREAGIIVAASAAKAHCAGTRLRRAQGSSACQPPPAGQLTAGVGVSSMDSPASCSATHITRGSSAICGRGGAGCGEQGSEALSVNTACTLVRAHQLPHWSRHNTGPPAHPPPPAHAYITPTCT